MTEDQDTPQTTLCTYRVRRGEEDAFAGLLGRHWTTLHRAGLVTDAPSRVYRGQDETGGTYFVEVFDWASAEAASEAHEREAVAAIWEPMTSLCEARGGRPAMEFAEVTPLTVMVDGPK